MSVSKPLYGTNNQSITCTITSLANNGQQGSAAIDNTTNLFDDAPVMVIIKTGAGTSASSTVNIYAYGTVNGGTNYSDGVTGTNASQTLTNPPNVKLIGTINCPANTSQFVGGPFPVAPYFGGVLPDHWGIVVENKSGGALDASVGSAFYQGVQIQTV